MLTFDFSVAPHGTQEIFEYLKVCAKNLYTNNYATICEDIKQSSRGAVSILPRGIGTPLGYIRTLCIEHHVPWINALAVNKEQWRPSESFLPSNVNWDPSHELLWRGMVLQVFAYDWSQIAMK
jgi:hypothetical protein